MGKARTSISIDEDLKEEIDARPDLNLSGLINELLRHYLRGRDEDTAAKQMQIERLRREADEMREEASSIERQAETLESQLEEQRQKTEEVLDEAAEILYPQSLNVNDRPVQFWADEAGVTPEELIEEVRKRGGKQSGENDTYE